MSLAQPSLLSPALPTASKARIDLTGLDLLPAPTTSSFGLKASSLSTTSAPISNDHEAPMTPAEDTRRKEKRRTLGDWNLDKTIGAGSMGKVKLARHRVTGEQVAVKIIPRIKLRDKNIKDPKDPDNKKRDHDESKEIRTVRESAISILLRHPYICGMRDVMIMSHHYYMLFEYVDGGQMLDYIISHGKLKEKQARKFARQIASALDYCHYNSIAHRDLKIENILISKEGDIKIIDFGLSNLYSPRAQLSTFCGSLYFAAPELLNAKAYTGPEVDVWSFGIVLYVLVCGKVPFDDQSMPALHAKIKRGIVEYPSFISAECKHLISRMLVVPSSQRATMTEIINHPWMVKGLETPIDSHTISRQPLTLPLDSDVIDGMTGFDFGTRDEIAQKLTDVVTSDDYKRSSKFFNAMQNDHTLGIERRESKFRKRDSTAYPTSPVGVGPVNGHYFENTMILDPTKAYHPLLSIYYLVEEKQARNRKEKEHAEGIILSTNKPELALQIPTIPMPEEAHAGETSYEIQDKPPASPIRSPTTPRARSRTHGELEMRAAVKRMSLAPPAGPVMPAVQAVKKESGFGLLRRLSSRRYRKEAVAANPEPIPVPSPNVPAPTPVLELGSPRKKPDETIPISPQPRAGSSVVRATSASEAKKYMNRRSMIETTGKTDESSGFKQGSMLRPMPEEAAPRSMRAKSLGHVRGDELQDKRAKKNDLMASPIISSIPEGQSVNGLSASDRDYVKPVSLKGLFSVSTTSTKGAPAIRSDLLRTLDQLGVSHTEIKGGYTCIHRPSIDVAANGDRPTPEPANLSDLHRTPSKMRRRLSFARSSRPRSTSSTTHRLSAASESADSMMEDMLDSSTALRFEVYIVKISWFNLRGVQFKRVSGNSWQYKNLASKILSELRL